MSRCALVVRMSYSSISWHMDGSLPVCLARWGLDRLHLRAPIRLLSLTDGLKLLPYQYVIVHDVGSLREVYRLMQSITNVESGFPSDGRR